MKLTDKNDALFARLHQPLFYLSLLIIVFILTFITHSPDYDLWARLAVGSIFFQTGTVLHHDIFSYIPVKAHWIDHEWGAGVIFYGFVRYFGEWGIFLLKAGSIFAMLLLIVKTITLEAKKRTVGVLYLILIGFALFPGVASTIRSQMFTYVFFSLWLYLLEKIRHDGKRLLWIFPASMLLWVNVHGGFVAGIGLVAIYAAGEFLNRNHPLPYLKILAMILPLTLVTPYGAEFLHYIIAATRMARPDIPEWLPIRLDGPYQLILGVKVHFLAGFIALALLTIAGTIKQLVTKNRPDYTRLLLAGILLFLGIRHQRHTAFFVIGASALFHQQYLALFAFVTSPISKRLGGICQKTWTITKQSFGYLLLLIIFVAIMPRLYFHFALNPKEYPYGSMEFIEQNHLSGNLATTFTWSSYAFWKLYPQCRVLIDGRYEEVYADTVFNEAMQLSKKSGNWYTVLNKYHTDIIVLPKLLYQPEDLQKIPDWDVAYQDFISVVLLPKDTMGTIFIKPDYKNPIYLNENYAKRIPLPAKPQ